MRDGRIEGEGAVILHPSVLALVGSALLVGALLVYSAVVGRPDPPALGPRRAAASGSSRWSGAPTCVSTLLGYALVFGLASLFLFVFTADSLAPLFTGAMCAAGSLHASPYGYPVLLLQIAGFALASALWLVVNRADAPGARLPAGPREVRLPARPGRRSCSSRWRLRGRLLPRTPSPR